MRYHQLTEAQRYQIARLNSLGKSKSDISVFVGVHRSTIYREIARNSFKILFEPGPVYDAIPANEISRCRRLEACEKRGKVHGSAKSYIVKKLRCKWSPEQIAGRAKLKGFHALSYSSIYRFIERDRNDFCGNDYHTLLRRHCNRRRRKRKTRVCHGRKGAPKKSIRERPKESDLRRELGHFERDLMEGPRGKGAVLVVVDRKSRRLALRLVDKDGAHVQKVTSNILKSKGLKLCAKTITNDNGSEFIPAISSKSEEQFGIPVYFCDPCSPWQRGTVENSIGLLRQYLPKKYDFSKMSAQKLRRIEDQLNNRPRKILNFKTPSEIFFADTNGKKNV